MERGPETLLTTFFFILYTLDDIYLSQDGVLFIANLILIEQQTMYIYIYFERQTDRQQRMN